MNLNMDIFLLLNLSIMCMILLVLVFKFMLMVLMVMELVIVSFSMIILMLFSSMGMEIFMVYYLVFGVCESVLGLMMLVVVIRFYGNEYYYSINLFKFM